MQPASPLLLVEDDELDLMIAKRSLKELEIANPIVIKRDGEEALAYLLACAGNKPSVVLLDLNMPRLNGFEFLQRIKAHEDLKDIPVVVVTTSTATADIARSFELGACAYVVKSMDSDEFRRNLGRVTSLCHCSDCMPIRSA